MTGLILSFVMRSREKIDRLIAWGGMAAGILLGFVVFGVRMYDPKGMNLPLTRFNRWVVVAIAAAAAAALLWALFSLLLRRVGGVWRTLGVVLLTALTGIAFMYLAPSVIQFTQEFVYFGESGLSTKALLRAIATVASDITGMVQDGTGGASAVLDAAEQKIYAVRRGRSAQNMEQISVVLQGVLDHLAELSATGGKTLPGLSTGLSAVDDKINGLSKSDLILLAARPGMGKTSFALNVALNVAKASGKAVAVFSLEMSKEQLVTRVLSNEALVENGRLISGNLRESDWVKIAEAASTLSRTDIKIDDNPLLTVADMNAKCRRIENLGLVVIDYLQLMTSAGGKGYSGENRQQAVSDISRMLKIMAKELQVPVLCLSQLSRANEKRDDKRPMLSDLRESGAIEQDADIVLFLYRDDYYNEDSEKHNIAECIVAKNRHGETGKVELRWMPEYTTFGTLERRYEDE